MAYGVRVCVRARFSSIDQSTRTIDPQLNGTSARRLCACPRPSLSPVCHTAPHRPPARTPVHRHLLLLHHCCYCCRSWLRAVRVQGHGGRMRRSSLHARPKQRKRKRKRGRRRRRWRIGWVSAVSDCHEKRTRRRKKARGRVGTRWSRLLMDCCCLLLSLHPLLLLLLLLMLLWLGWVLVLALQFRAP